MALVRDEIGSEQHTVLVVEDDPKVMKVLVDRLKHNGFEVATADNGKKGLNMCKSVNPDLMIVDILMPQMDGITMLKKIRAESWGRDIPVIILTNAQDDPEHTSGAWNSHVTHFLAKSDTTINKVMDLVKQEIGGLGEF